MKEKRPVVYRASTIVHGTVSIRYSTLATIMAWLLQGFVNRGKLTAISARTGICIFSSVELQSDISIRSTRCKKYSGVSSVAQMQTKSKTKFSRAFVFWFMFPDMIFMMLRSALAHLFEGITSSLCFWTVFLLLAPCSVKNYLAQLLNTLLLVLGRRTSKWRSYSRAKNVVLLFP